MNNSDNVAGIPNVEALRALKPQAAQLGFNLFHVLTPADLGVAGLPWPVLKLQNPQHPGFLLLLGNGGGDLWRRLAEQETKGQSARLGFSGVACDKLMACSADNPLDRASEQLVRDLIRSASSLAGVKYHILYPGGENTLPLQQLGAIAGWHSGSPLGTGIHPEWGAWFAYRVLLWVELAAAEHAPIQGSRQQSRPSKQELQAPASFAMGDICLSCQSRACVSACPGQAIEFAASPNMDACARYRLSDNSQCGDTCKSREACPVGRADRHYSRAQINYHYRVALKGLENYYGGPLDGKDNP